MYSFLTVYLTRSTPLSSDILDPDLCIDFYTMEAINSEAQLALDFCKVALAKVVVAFKPLPGDLTIIDNRMVAHGRTGFKARYDGKDRWLQRLYTIQDFHRSKIIRQRGSHMCRPFDEYSQKNAHVKPV